MITSPFSPQGRIRRKHFFIAFIVFSIAGKLLDRAVEDPSSSPLLLVFYALIIWPWVNLVVQRAHDAGRDGKYVATALSLFIGSAFVFVLGAGLIGDELESSMLSIFAGVVLGAIFLTGFVMTLIVYFSPGELGINKYGPNPRLQHTPINADDRGEPDDELIDLAKLRGYDTGD